VTRDRRRRRGLRPGLAIDGEARRQATFRWVWYADMAPITPPEVVPVASSAGPWELPTSRALDQRSHAAIRPRPPHAAGAGTLRKHLREASDALVNRLLRACSRGTVLATSREPLLV